MTAAGPCRAPPIRTACAASSKPSAWPWPPVRARDRPTATATLPPRRALQPRRQLRLVADAQQRDRLQAAHRAGRAGERRRAPPCARVPAPRRDRPPPDRPRTRRPRAARPARCRAGGPGPPARPPAPRRRRAPRGSRARRSGPRPGRSAGRSGSPAPPSPRSPPSTSSSAGVAAWRPALTQHADQLAAGLDRRRDAGGGVGDAGQHVAVPRLGQHPHPARERVEQRGVGDALDAPPRAGDGADAEAAARVARREQHRVGARAAARADSARPCSARRRAAAEPRSSTAEASVRTASSCRRRSAYELRRLDGGGHERRDRRHQREVVLGELVRAPRCAG